MQLQITSRGFLKVNSLQIESGIHCLILGCEWGDSVWEDLLSEKKKKIGVTVVLDFSG